MDDWTIEKFSLRKFKGLNKKLKNVKEAFLLDSDGKDSLLRDENSQPTILFSTFYNAIYLAEARVKANDYERFSNLAKSVDDFRHVALVRGFNNHFYYVDSDNNSDV